MDGRVVVDTDVLVDYFASVSPGAEAVERLLRQDRLVVTALTLFELACGTQTPNQLYDLDLLVQAIEPLTLDVSAALRAGAVYQELRTKGQLVDTSDLLIAGCCLASALPLLTRNTEHFSRVPGLKLIDVQQLLKIRG